VLAGEVARAVRAGKDLGAVKDRHFCFWNEPTTSGNETRQSLRKATTQHTKWQGGLGR
jgi:hypothetical protein